MPIQPPVSRYTVEKEDDLIRVTLPAKKNVFQIIWGSLWLVWFGVIFGMVLFVVSRIYLLNQMERTTSPVGQETNMLIIIGLIFIPFFLFMVGIGAYGLQSFLWSIVGKEIIEADPTYLRIIRQIFSRKKTREFYSKDVKDLRVGVNNSWFNVAGGIRKRFRNNGVIAFDYGAKTYRFGSDIDEAEAKMIISIVGDGLIQKTE